MPDPNVGDMIQAQTESFINGHEKKAFFKQLVRNAASDSDFAGGNPYLLENFEPFIENFVFAYQRTILKIEKDNLKRRMEKFANPNE